MASAVPPDATPFFDELHRRVKEIQPTNYDGIHVMINKPLSPHLQVAHIFNMGSFGSSYKFGANFVGTKQVSPMEMYPIMISEMECDGTLSANFVHMISPRLKAKIIGAFAKNRCTGTQLGLDYRGDSFTAATTLANIDLIKNSGILVGQYLHQLTSCFAIGPQVLLHYGQQESMTQVVTQISAGCRLSGENYQCNAILSPGSAHLSYYQKYRDDLHFGTEFQLESASKQCDAAFYYQYDLTKSHVSFKGTFDSSWNVGGILEKRFYPLPVSLQLNAAHSHTKNRTSVGIGLQIG